MVTAWVEASDLYAEPLLGNPDITPELHAARIAYFVKFGWKDAIAIDIGVPELGCHVERPVQDGNHRLAAAIFRNDESILAEVAGSTAFAAELFGVQI